MKLINGVIVGGLAFLGYKLFQTAKAAYNFTYGISYYHIDTAKSGARGLVGTLGLSIYNPSETNVTYERFVGNMYYNGSIAGNIDPAKTNVSIKGRANTVVPLNIVFPLSFFGFSLVDIVKKLVSGQKITLSKKVRLVGKIKVTGFPDIPVDTEINLNDYI